MAVPPSPPVDVWLCGYLIEFADDGPLERVIVREGTESECDRAAAGLGLIIERGGRIPYEGDRPVLHGFAFVCRRADLTPLP